MTFYQNQLIAMATSLDISDEKPCYGRGTVQRIVTIEKLTIDE